jgi:hypothetical protein
LTEARITIGDKVLTEAQSMTVRVALSSFHVEIWEDDPLGTDEHARQMTDAYRERLAEIMPMVVK